LGTICLNLNFALSGMKIPDKTRLWFKRIGWIGFLFFLIKGILWLVAGAAIIEWFNRVF